MKTTTTPKAGRILIGIVLHGGALIPLFLIILDAVLGRLTANPIQELQVRTGQSALILITVSLACTPFFVLSGWDRFLSFRRPLGLYAFGYAALHFMNLVGLDYQFNFPLLWEDIAQKQYVLVGFPAFVILLALALTSTGAAKRKLGKNWKRLHRLVYVAAALGVVHYLWAAKVQVAAPFIYGGIIGFLLVMRIPGVDHLLQIGLPWRKNSDPSVSR